MMTKTEFTQSRFHMLTINDMVPETHLLRKIHSLVDFSFVYEQLEGAYCIRNGRPSIDPVVLIKMLLIHTLTGCGVIRERLIDHSIWPDIEESRKRCKIRVLILKPELLPRILHGDDTDRGRLPERFQYRHLLAFCVPPFYIFVGGCIYNKLC